MLTSHKLIKPTIPYRGNFDIGYKIEQSQIALTTAAKNLEKKRALQKKPYENRPSDHSFKVGDLVLLYKHNKDKLDLQWEPGYRIVELQSPWTAKITNKTTGEPKRVNVRDLRLKDPAEDWDLKAESMGREPNLLMIPQTCLTLTGHLKMITYLIMTMVTHQTRTKTHLTMYKHQDQEEQ